MRNFKGLEGDPASIIADDCTHAAGTTLIGLSTLEEYRSYLDFYDRGSMAMVIAADQVDETSMKTLEKIYADGIWLILLGEISPSLARSFGKNPTVIIVEDREDLTRNLRDRDTVLKLILVLNPESFVIAASLDDVFGTAFLPASIKKTNSTERSVLLEGREGRFRMIWGEGSALERGVDRDGEAVIPASVAGMGLRYIARGAYAHTKVTAVRFVAPLRTIARGAFYKCAFLKTITFPLGLDYIGRSAFSGCVSLREIDLPRSLRTIGPRAFKGCRGLQRVYMPGSVKTIGKDAFALCSPDVVFEVEKDSPAYRWAIEHNKRHAIVEGLPTILPAMREILQDENFSYAVLPGGEAEILRFHGPSAEAITIPKTIEGRTVSGIGYRAFDSLEVEEVSCLSTLTWIAAKAFSDCPALEVVSASKNLFVVGDGAFPTAATVVPKIPLSRHPTDIEKASLSLRSICAITSVVLPVEMEAIADIAIRQVSASLKITKPGDIYLHRGSSDTAKASRRAKERGAVGMIAAITSERRDLALPTLFVEDPMKIYEAVCAWFAQQNNVKTIALTGSIGKTTTKEMVRLVCEKKYRTVYSKGNENGVAQVGRYLQSLTRDNEVYLQETGASGFGSVERVASFMKPDAFLVTNVGLNHVGYYGNLQENIVLDKTSHDKYLPDEGVAFLNYDDDNLRSARIDHQVISFGVESRDTDYYAESIVERDGQIHFDIVDVHERNTIPVVVHSFGIHNVYNALAAFAIGKWLGIGSSEIVKGIGEYRGKGLRQNLVTLGEHQVLVDCYNASEGSAASTVKALQSIRPNSTSKHYMVFADIDDKLGSLTEEVHRRVGENFAKQDGVDELIFFGKHAAWSAEEARKGSVPVFETRNREMLNEHLAQVLRANDVVAFKGGQQMALSITIDSLWGTSFVLEDGDELSKRVREVELNGIDYRVIREYGAQARRISETFNDDVLALPSEVMGQPLMMVGRLFAYNRAIREVVIPEPTKNIATSAFYLCKSLVGVSLPESLRRIERSAFNNCRSLQQVVVPSGVEFIGDRAFYRCEDLRSIIIPPSVKQMGEKIFNYSLQVEIICEENSFAEEFCRTHWAKRRIKVVKHLE